MFHLVLVSLRKKRKLKWRLAESCVGEMFSQEILQLKTDWIYIQEERVHRLISL